VSWPAVRAWRDALRRTPLADLGLSPDGARAAMDAALDAWTDDALDAIAEMPVAPYADATLVCARTVFTAPLEWSAVLLGRGTRLTWKLPSAPGLRRFGELAAMSARSLGLPLSTAEGHGPPGGELVVVMGSDRTVDEIRNSLRPDQAFLGFGHRFSAAFVGDEGSFTAVARDAAMHDGRGCLSPVVVFSDHPRAHEALADAMADAETRWPRGEVAPVEHAALRERAALGAVLGRVSSGSSWQVAEVPAALWRPLALPRSIVLVHVATPQAVAAALAPFQGHLSTIATDTALPIDAPQVRPGDLQRPPLRRAHDGVDWLRETGRPR
jgi:hypothetical protein